MPSRSDVPEDFPAPTWGKFEDSYLFDPAGGYRWLTPKDSDGKISPPAEYMCEYVPVGQNTPYIAWRCPLYVSPDPPGVLTGQIIGVDGQPYTQPVRALLLNTKTEQIVAVQDAVSGVYSFPQLINVNRFAVIAYSKTGGLLYGVSATNLIPKPA